MYTQNKSEPYYVCGCLNINISVHESVSRVISTCSEYGTTYAIRYNGEKNSLVCCAPRNIKHLSPLTFSTHDRIIQKQNVVKYLGHIINEPMFDDGDINRHIKIVC